MSRENSTEPHMAAATVALGQIEQIVAAISPDGLPEMLGALESLRAQALFRLMTVNGRGLAPASEDRLLPVEAVAERLGGLSRSYAYELLRRGTIPSVRLGRHRFVRASTLTDFMAAKESGAGLDGRPPVLPNPRRTG